MKRLIEIGLSGIMAGRLDRIPVISEKEKPEKLYKPMRMYIETIKASTEIIKKLIGI